MEDYIKDLNIKVGHTKPIKSQLLPYKHTPIFMGTARNSPPTLIRAPRSIQRVSSVCKKNVGALLYYSRAVDKQIMVSLSAIGSQQAAATVDTAMDVEQLLNYIATYPHYGITYRASDMILAAHSYASYLNKPLSRSRAVSHIFI